MKEIALHILDILENSVRAKAKNIWLEVNISDKNNWVSFNVKDDGKGMSPETLAQVQDPFYTTRTTRKVGLGIPMLMQNTEMAGGSVLLESELGKGTQVRAKFQLKNIDRPPFGTLYDGLVNMIISFPEPNWIIIYASDRESFEFNLEETLGEDRAEVLQLPEMVLGIKDLFKENINIIHNTVTNLEIL